MQQVSFILKENNSTKISFGLWYQVKIDLSNYAKSSLTPYEKINYIQFVRVVVTAYIFSDIWPKITWCGQHKLPTLAGLDRKFTVFESLVTTR